MYEPDERLALGNRAIRFHRWWNLFSALAYELRNMTNESIEGDRVVCLASCCHNDSFQVPHHVKLFE